MDFNLSIPVKVVSGKNCVTENSALFIPFGKRALIVTGGKSAKLSGALDDVSTALEKEGIAFSVFDEITENPLISSCVKAGALAREECAEFIIGIGGGSPLDAAKATAVFAANEELAGSDIYLGEKRNAALPIVCVGTTAGTGSEVGRVSVLTNDENGRKKSISPLDCTPSLTFADPKYTESMPFSVTCSTALDALSHALEGFFSVKCGDIPTLFAKKGIALIWEGLKLLDETKKIPSSETREKLYYGSLYAGITLAYCGTAFPHPLGYVLTENFRVPHGFACAAFLPEFLHRAAEFSPERHSGILELIKTDQNGFDGLVRSLTVLPEIEMSEEEIDGFVSRWEIAPANFRFTPGGFTKEDAKKIFIQKFLKEGKTVV